MSIAEPTCPPTIEPTAATSRRPFAAAARWVGRAALALAIVGFWVEVAPRVLFGIDPLTKESIVFQYHPRLGWWHEPGKSGVFVKIDCKQPVTINSKGLREREIGYEKDPGVYRILVLGNSVTVGFEVPAEKVLTRVMEEELGRLGHGAQVINAACRGWGSDQSLIFLREEGLKYHPDLVVYVIGGIEPTTNMELHRPYRDYGKGYFDLGDDGRLTLRNVPVPHYRPEAEVFLAEDGRAVERTCSAKQAWFLWFRDTVVCRSSACTLLLNTLMSSPALTRALNDRGAYVPTADAAQALDPLAGRANRLTAATFKEMRRASEASGAKFMLCAPTTLPALGPEYPAFFAAAGLPYWDFQKEARDRLPRGVPLHFPHDAHLNVAGHDAVGRAIARGLVARARPGWSPVTAPYVPQMGGRALVVVVALCSMLAASAALNVVLYRLAIDHYRDQMAVRLDPTDASRSVAPPALAPGQTRIVYVGDSRVQLWAHPPAPEGCQVVNRGVGGETTEQVLLRLDRDVLALNPAIVVVQVGVNDLRSIALFPGREAEIADRCEANLRAIVGRLRGRGPFVIVTTIFPVGRVELARRPIWSDATIDAIDRANRSLRALNVSGVVVVDCDRILRNGRRIDPAFAVDSLHLSGAGYEALAASLRPVLGEAVGVEQGSGQDLGRESRGKP